MVPSSLPASMTGTFGSSHSISLDALVLISAATRSDNLELQTSQNPGVESILPRHPSSKELLDKVNPTLSCLGEHLHIQGRQRIAFLLFLVNKAQWRKTTRRFRAMASTLAEPNAESLSAQTVNDLLTMYVSAANQHVLRMSFVPEHEAKTFRH